MVKLLVGHGRDRTYILYPIKRIRTRFRTPDYGGFPLLPLQIEFCVWDPGQRGRQAGRAQEVSPARNCSRTRPANAGLEFPCF